MKNIQIEVSGGMVTRVLVDDKSIINSTKIVVIDYDVDNQEGNATAGGNNCWIDDVHVAHGTLQVKEVEA